MMVLDKAKLSAILASYPTKQAKIIEKVNKYFGSSFFKNIVSKWNQIIDNINHGSPPSAKKDIVNFCFINKFTTKNNIFIFRYRMRYSNIFLYLFSLIVFLLKSPLINIKRGIWNMYM